MSHHYSHTQSLPYIMFRYFVLHVKVSLSNLLFYWTSLSHYIIHQYVFIYSPDKFLQLHISFLTPTLFSIPITSHTTVGYNDTHPLSLHIQLFLWSSALPLSMKCLLYSLSKSHNFILVQGMEEYCPRLYKEHHYHSWNNY